MSGKIFVSKKAFFCLILFLAISLLINLNYVRQVSAKDSGLDDKYSFLKTFVGVLSIVEKNYVENVNIKDLVSGAIKGMLLTLDPHSGYMDKEVFKELQVETKGEFGGLGIEITIKDGFLTVVAPIEDSPAFRAGIRAGDQIIKIGEEFSKNLSLIDAVKKMRGPKGTPVTISVHREGIRELLPYTMIRDVIKVSSVRSRMLEDGFAWIKITQFQDATEHEFVKALDNLTNKKRAEGLKGLVLDMRNNPGGLLTQAIRISDIFLKEGVIVYTDGRLENQKQKYFAHDDGEEPKYPIVVLVNGGSASASEIVSGALQDHGRGLIVGQQTFGKGSVQTIFPLEDNDALRLTTALYFTSNGRSIQAQGITPDIIIEDKEATPDKDLVGNEDERIFPRKERDLPGALRNPKDKQESEEKEQQGISGEQGKQEEKSEKKTMTLQEAMSAKLSDLLREDAQLAEALRLLKTWNVFQGKPAAATAKQST